MIDTCESRRIVYSDRKTLALSMEPDGRLIIRAPRGTADQHINEFVQKHAFWIHSKRNLVQKQQERASKKEYVSGETFPYLGRNYRLDVRDLEREQLAFQNKFILPRQLRDHASQLFLSWYKSRARERIQDRADYWARVMSVSFNEVMISEMSRRWATCTAKKNLNFNWRLIMAPTQVIDYVVVHELAHIAEPVHSERFWTIVRVTLPNYRESLSWLERHGQDLEFEL